MKKVINEYWDISRSWDANGTYTVVLGQRSNGKTYATLKKGLEEYALHGHQMAILRTWQEDFKGRRGQTLFTPLVENGVVDDLFEGTYNMIVYKSMQWFLATIDQDSNITLAPEPFAFGFSLNQMSHDKSSGGYSRVKLIVYDEFVSAGFTMDNAFDLFMNTISTIVRDRTDARIYLLGNTMESGFFSPFLEEMGINPRKIEQGSLTTFTYADNKELTVVVEYCDAVNRSDKQNKYYAFGRSKSSGMITTGEWALPMYQRLPEKIEGKKILHSVFVQYKTELVQIDIVKMPEKYILFAHKKTTPIKKPKKDIIYDIEYRGTQKNIIKNILLDNSRFSLKITQMIRNKDIYYGDNTTGEVIRNWLHDCQVNTKIVK